LAALHWWHDRCIEWCYFRVEDGKMGDQKYLEEFPTRFERVHILEHPGGGLAPWNVTNHELGGDGENVLVDGRPLVFFHYHSLRLYHPGPAARVATAVGYLRRGVPPLPLPWSTNYAVPPVERRLVWEPYLRTLGEELTALQRSGMPTLPGVQRVPVRELALRTLRGIARRSRSAGLGLGRRISPLRWVALRFSLYHDSWKSREVAAQMVELTNRELERPETVPPYRSFKELLQLLVDEPELPAPARFLDIGCGAGAYAELLERWAPGRFDYLGADYSEQIVHAAQARFPNKTFERRDLFEPGALQGFDVVFASSLVDVLAQYDDALDTLLAADAPWILLHRQRIARHARAEVARGYRGQRTYRSYVTLEDLERAAQRHGRRIAGTVKVDGQVHSFLLTR
jgi:SAM-dependent methyltransferase